MNFVILVNRAWQTLSDSHSWGIIVIHSALTLLGATAGFSLQSLLVIWQVRRDSGTTSNWGTTTPSQQVTLSPNWALAGPKKNTLIGRVVIMAAPQQEYFREGMGENFSSMQCRWNADNFIWGWHIVCKCH